jgi:N-acetylneuraminic acid mutarotase
MNKFLSVSIAFLFCLTAQFNYAQDLTWMNGSTFSNTPGKYGVQGAPSLTYNPGGREGAASWKDMQGNFWLFGGNGYDYIGNSDKLNDLWKYNPVTNEWTWVKGSNVIAQVGTYGTMGVPSPGNNPGSRGFAASWVDASGDFWLFGGNGYGGTASLGNLSDLWKYNISSNEWTWMGGSSLVFQPGDYGTIGVSAPTNMPGSRYSACTWKDSSDDLWLLGGVGNTSSPSIVGSLNDLWKYNILNNEWTWIKGSNTINQNGSYGLLGLASPANEPGAREMASSWTDAQGAFWLFGGKGYDAGSAVSGYLNDLWKYDAGTNEWTWLKGSDTLNRSGVYGTAGIAASSNMPGARAGAMTWIDAIGTMWLAQGQGYPSAPAVGNLNDIWKFNKINLEWTWIKGSSVINQNGVYSTQGTSSAFNISGSRRNAVCWMDSMNNLWWFGGQGRAQSGNDGRLSDLWKFSNCFISPITMTVVSKDNLICAGETTSLTASGSNNYAWLNTVESTPYLVISPSVTTSYTVVTSDNNNCKYYASFTQSVNACTGLSEATQFINYGIYPNPNNGTFKLLAGNSENPKRIIIYNISGQVVYNEKIIDSLQEVRVNLLQGIYHYVLLSGELSLSKGRLVID